MGLFNRFKKNRNHAEDFREAYERKDMGKVQSVLVDWLDNGKHDALFGLAMVILVATRKDKPLPEALAIFKSSIEQDKCDAGLYGWYESTALKLLDDWSGEEMSGNPDLKGKFEQSSSDGSNFDELTCKDFSRAFKNLYDGLADADYDEIGRYMGKLNQLLEVWERKCPDDSHLPCAYVMVHAPELSEDDLGDYVFRHASGETYDESLHEWYQDGLAMAIKAVQTMNK